MYWESGGIAPRILNLGTRRRWLVRFTSRPLYPRGKSPRHSMKRRMGGSQSRTERGGPDKKKKNSITLAPTWTESRSSSSKPSLYTDWAPLLLSW